MLTSDHSLLDLLASLIDLVEIGPVHEHLVLQNAGVPIQAQPLQIPEREGGRERKELNYKLCNLIPKPEGRFSL